MKKSEFFAILNNPENRTGVTAHIATFGDNELIIKQTGAPNSYLSTHRATTTLNAAFTKYNNWLNEWFTIQTAHAEALEIDAAVDGILYRLADPYHAHLWVALPERIQMQVMEAAYDKAREINSAIEAAKPIVTCEPLPEDAKLPKVKPFHVTFTYHHSMWGDGQATAKEGFRDLMFVMSERDDLAVWEQENKAQRPKFHAFLDGKQKEAESKIEKGLAIQRTAEHNLNQWGSGESGHAISRNFEFLNPENFDFY